MLTSSPTRLVAEAKAAKHAHIEVADGGAIVDDLDHRSTLKIYGIDGSTFQLESHEAMTVALSAAEILGCTKLAIQTSVQMVL